MTPPLYSKKRRSLQCGRRFLCVSFLFTNFADTPTIGQASAWYACSGVYLTFAIDAGTETFAAKADTDTFVRDIQTQAW